MKRIMVELQKRGAFAELTLRAAGDERHDRITVGHPMRYADAKRFAVWLEDVLPEIQGFLVACEIQGLADQFAGMLRNTETLEMSRSATR